MSEIEVKYLGDMVGKTVLCAVFDSPEIHEVRILDHVKGVENYVKLTAFMGPQWYKEENVHILAVLDKKPEPARSDQPELPFGPDNAYGN